MDQQILPMGDYALADLEDVSERLEQVDKEFGKALVAATTGQSLLFKMQKSRLLLRVGFF